MLKNNESETVARNIMVILSRTGNNFRLLGWEEYKQHRMNDGNFSDVEKEYFDKVAGFCVAEESALAFSENWGTR